MLLGVLPYLLGLSVVLAIDDICFVEDVHAIVLARGGSKGIKYKNLLNINGVSLLGRSLLTLINSRSFAQIWVSTDSEAIAQEAFKYGVSVHRRPEVYARDDTTSLESVEEFLTQHASINRFALVQCTSVFLEERFLHRAIQLFETNDCVFSATRSHKLRWHWTEDGKLKPLNFKADSRPRRQDWDGELIENGMFYFASRALVKAGHFQNERCSIVEIPIENSLEIDNANDVQLAECLLDMRKKPTKPGEK